MKIFDPKIKPKITPNIPEAPRRRNRLYPKNLYFKEPNKNLEKSFALSRLYKIKINHKF
jgi:hypothetical protein